MVRGAKSRGPRDHCGVTSFLLRLVKLTLSPIPAEADNQANLGRRRSATFNVLLELLVSSLTKLGVGYEESSLLQVYKIYDNTVRTQRLYTEHFYLSRDFSLFSNLIPCPRG